MDEAVKLSLFSALIKFTVEKEKEAEKREEWIYSYETHISMYSSLGVPHNRKVDIVPIPLADFSA